MSVRLIVLSVVVVSLAAGCGGEDGSGEEAGGLTGQYEGAEPTAAADSATAGAGAGFSQQECLREASASGEAGVKIVEPEQVPSYEVVEEKETQTGAEMEVVTEAQSPEELKAVAERLRFENRDQNSLSLDFYNERAGGRRDAGIALVFNTREAACRAFEYPVEEQDRLVSESNGVSVVSVEAGV